MLSPQPAATSVAWRLALPVAAWASWRGASDRDAAGLRWNTPLRLPAIPGARETVRPLVLCTVTPASGWEVSVETG